MEFMLAGEFKLELPGTLKLGAEVEAEAEADAAEGLDARKSK